MVTELRRPEDLEQLLDRSRKTPILIFKHSTQCPVSAAAHSEFIQFAADAADVPCGIVLVIENRALSEMIESKFSVRHESPQALVVENGKLKWTASHWSITSEALDKAIKG